MKKFIASLALLFVAVSVLAAKPAQFNVASYNIRMPAGSDSIAGNGWGRRGAVVAKLAYFNDFDIFGTQEGYKFQLDEMLREMPGYAYIGVGREDGKNGGEHSAIFYNTDMFEVLDHGDFWLAEDTTYPHLGWDAACVRICTWGKFRHKPSGRQFLFFNLHMDHVGKIARIESANLIKKKMNELGSKLPVFLTGDFNIDQFSDEYTTITGDGKLRDAYTDADFVFAPNGTFNSFHTDGFSNQRIDHIFTTPDVHVLKYGVLTDTYRTTDDTDGALSAENAPEAMRISKATARTPSDHFPIKAKIELR